MSDNLYGKFILQLGPLKEKISDTDYFRICQLNELLLIERSANGDWEIQSLNDNEDSARIAVLTGEFGRWVRENGTGIGFAAFTGFLLPNGAVRAPDLSWVKREKWDTIPPEKRKKFAHIAPDFVIELRSASDALKDLQDKMEEYTANGVRLGWLIDTKRKRVYVYRPDAGVEILRDPPTEDGGPVLTGFVLRMAEIWG